MRARPLTPRLPAGIALARAAGFAARLGGRGGTSLPGKVLLRVDPDAVRHLVRRLPGGCVLLSATNGKTTTAAMAAGILRHAGRQLVHNRAGANMGGGVAAALLSAARPRGRMTGELGLFEVDEFWLDRLAGAA
jgi:UDP-N-acetylmuramyl tripeptide synthase